MNIRAILTVRGDDVVTVAGTETLSSVCDVLTRHKIGAVVVCDGARSVRGIISERDIVLAISAHGASALDATVANHMTRDVMTCSETDSVLDVMSRMTTGRFRHMPVVENGAMIGLVSIGDIVKARIAQAERDAEEMRSYILAG